MNISFYDKFQEMRKHKRHRKLSKTAKDVVRIEAQINGTKLRDCLANGRNLTKLDLRACYRALRRILLPFSPACIIRASNFWQVCYLAIAERWKVGSQPAIDILLSNYSPTGRAKFIRQLQRKRLQSFNIDWQKKLPPKMPRVLIIQNGCAFSSSGNLDVTP